MYGWSAALNPRGIFNRRLRCKQHAHLRPVLDRENNSKVSAHKTNAPEGLILRRWPTALQKSLYCVLTPDCFNLSVDDRASARRLKKHA